MILTGTRCTILVKLPTARSGGAAAPSAWPGRSAGCCCRARRAFRGVAPTRSRSRRQPAPGVRNVGCIPPLFPANPVCCAVASKVIELLAASCSPASWTGWSLPWSAKSAGSAALSASSWSPTGTRAARSHPHSTWGERYADWRRRMGVLVRNRSDVINLAPPFVMTEQEADQVTVLRDPTRRPSPDGHALHSCRASTPSCGGLPDMQSVLMPLRAERRTDGHEDRLVRAGRHYERGTTGQANAPSRK